MSPVNRGRHYRGGGITIRSVMHIWFQVGCAYCDLQTSKSSKTPTAFCNRFQTIWFLPNGLLPLPVGEGNEGKGLMARQALSPSLSQRERETTLLIIRNPSEPETGRITEPCNAPVVRAPESSVVIRTLRFFCAWEDARNFSATTAVWNSKGSSGRPNSNGSPLRQMNRTQGAGALPDTVLTYPLRSD